MQKLMLVVVVVALAIMCGCNTPATNSAVMSNCGGLTPEMEQGRRECMAERNALVSRLVEGGKLTPQELNIWGKEEATLMKSEANAIRAREDAEKQASNTSFPAGYTPTGTTGP